jgi:hypothetical protein
VVAEHDLGPVARWPRDVDILQQGDEYLFGYPLASVDGQPRRLGWALYDASRNQELRALGAIDGSGEMLPCDSLPAPMIPDLRQSWNRPLGIAEKLAPGHPGRQLNGLVPGAGHTLQVHVAVAA